MELLMVEILHQLIGSLSHYLQGFLYIPGGAGFQPSTVSHGSHGTCECVVSIFMISRASSRMSVEPRISLVTAGGCHFQDRKCTRLRCILNIHNILDMEDMEDTLDTQHMRDILDTQDIRDMPVESWERCLDQSLSKLILQTGPWLWGCWQLPLVPEWLMTCWQMCQKPLLQKLHDCS